MNELLMQVFSGIIVAVLAGVGGFIVKSRFFTEEGVLPKAFQRVERESYSHLNGKWYLYWLSYAPSDPSQPVWMQGLQELEVRGSLVRGSTQFVGHPILNLKSNLRGEIRAGKMIVLDTYVGDQTEFASIIYSNLRSRALLVGIWNGLDNQLRAIAAPAVLSRKEMDAAALNKALKESPMSLVPIGDYSVAQRVDDELDTPSTDSETELTSTVRRSAYTKSSN